MKKSNRPYSLPMIKKKPSKHYQSTWRVN